MMAQFFLEEDIETVVGPEKGAVLLSHDVAIHLTRLKGDEVISVSADKDGNDGFVFTDLHASFVEGRRVLVVEDILTTGTSARKTVHLTRNMGGSVIGIGALCNRGGVMPKDVGNVPVLHSLINLDLESWPEGECKLCEQDIPINTNVGHGAEFLARQK